MDGQTDRRQRPDPLYDDDDDAHERKPANISQHSTAQAQRSFFPLSCSSPGSDRGGGGYCPTKAVSINHCRVFLALFLFLLTSLLSTHQGPTSGQAGRQAARRESLSVEARLPDSLPACHTTAFSVQRAATDTLHAGGSGVGPDRLVRGWMSENGGWKRGGREDTAWLACARKG
ncbi:hypothetical protein B0T19DRAFT_34945 [Cercophora scortea]|uniref:Uncharacterized protein n=1 Tax=Cercophora scortea TaxID=314031 RepID=A0AAE0J3H1_9PEZI|nr:hypothetical protein B0T19DRAFT_34945 [Cercophora scortea]